MLAQTDIVRQGFSMSRPFAPSNEEARDVARIEEKAAIEACLAGDTAAFDVLVIRHQKSIQRVCYRFTGNAEDAADLTQEVFVKAYRSLPKFRGTSAFSTWLYRIAVNACLTFKAARKNRTPFGLVAVSAPALRVLQLARLDGVFAIHATLADGLAACSA